MTTAMHKTRIPDLSTLRFHDPGPPAMTVHDEHAHATGIPTKQASEWQKPRLSDLSKLKLHDGDAHAVKLPEDIAYETDPYMERLRIYAQSLPYSVEPNSKMQGLLDFILMRIVQCVKAKDFDPGFIQWDNMLIYWFMLKYPMPKQKRVALVKLYYEIATLPSMPSSVINVAVEGLSYLTKSKKKLSIDDLRLPWKPVYTLLSKELFLYRRKFEINHIPEYMGRIAESARRFFHPAATNEMLETFLPLMNGTNLDSVLSTEYYMLSFLPQTHPQPYLPMLFRLWPTINSYIYDGRMLQFLAELAEMHTNPSVSDPERVNELPDDAKSEDEGRPNWSQDDMKRGRSWRGIYKDVGIYSDDEWQFIMCKCLSIMEIPLADAGSLTTGPSVDKGASYEVRKRLRGCDWRIGSLAKLIVYSMSPDGLPNAASGAATPFTPGVMTPDPASDNNIGDYLSASLGKRSRAKIKTYLAGSKALDSLAHLIASTESFFHPSNSGAWTGDLTAFIKFVVYEFNKRWFEEQRPECKTPWNRRLTAEMKRELVKCLQTVTLLAMFSTDSTTVANVQSSLKSMTIMEPDLILHPILERAIPSLEALEETDRTMACMKVLGSVALALVSRDIYYPGAKHLVPVLELLIPGIDLNDPSKTLVTTNFLLEISQYIKFGDLTTVEIPSESPEDQMVFSESPMETTRPNVFFISMPDNAEAGQEQRLSKNEEDALLRESTASFADWIATFIRRVILLLENLPGEDSQGITRNATTEDSVVDAVCSACSQICVHLSEPLYELALNMIYDYATTTVRSNAVRAVHQLVECVANANPVKTLDRFLPFCARNIRAELEHGACSLRTTSMADPLPSDTTLHWNLAILRGTMSNDGKAVLKHKDELLDLLIFLRDKTFSKPGYSRSGKLLSNILLTLTHTYPLDNRFVNPDEWNSNKFKASHYLHWGKLYLPEDVKIAWHVPCAEEIEFAVTLFRQVVEPTMLLLEDLLKIQSSLRDNVWRNNFCRYLNLVRDAFAGIPTFLKDVVDIKAMQSSSKEGDYYYDLPEMIGHMEPLKSCFVLTDPSEPHFQYMTDLRKRFGTFLKDASLSLRQQGDENTVDAVHVLLDSMRVFALVYGDICDSYNAQTDRYAAEINYARQYADQQKWPRAVLVRRARRHHSARLRWNSVERLQGKLENFLIDEIVEWSIWNYITVRESAQALLASFAAIYDGVRKRSLPKYIENIRPGNDVNTVKGSLWSLRMQSFGRHAMTVPSYRVQYLSSLFACQPHSQPSIQDRVSELLETCLACATEPSSTVYSVSSRDLDKCVSGMEKLLPKSLGDEDLVRRCTEVRVTRSQGYDDCSKATVDTMLSIANSPTTHWRYSIVALKLLRSQIRRDKPLPSTQMKYFLNKLRDSHPSMRYYAQRAVMKSMRYIKMRTFFHSLEDVARAQCNNPLRLEVKLSPDETTTDKYLENFKTKDHNDGIVEEIIFQDKSLVGWLAWPQSVNAFRQPSPKVSSFRPWDPESQETVSCVRELVNTAEFWRDLSQYFSAENHNTMVTQDNISCVKSIFQLLEDEPFEYLKPTLESLINDVDQNKQRAAAELLAGILGGMKHWPTSAQDRIWDWLKPFLDKMLGSNIKSDTLSIWSTFMMYIFYKRDPRRVQPLLDHALEKFQACDFNGQMAFGATVVAALTKSIGDELGWRSAPWMDDILSRYWSELHSEHDEVRSYISDALQFAGKATWRPRPSVPSAEVFVRECRILPKETDIMGAHGTYHKERVAELVQSLAIWRAERLPGAKVLHSKYDRVGLTVCKWLFMSMHDIQASSNFDYILPLIPELLRFSELNDNEELSRRASALLVRMCGVIPPMELISPIVDALCVAIKTSSSWRIRLKALPLLQIFYFRQAPLISDAKLLEILEMTCWCLDDENIEVREMAATTLSGILRLSPRHSISTLKNRFIRLLDATPLPERASPDYALAIRKVHAAILGICAIVESYPYTVERWMPGLLADVLAEHTYDPFPISTTVRKCASNFKKTHQDTWHEDQHKFNEEQLSALSTLLTGSSYYA